MKTVGPYCCLLLLIAVAVAAIAGPVGAQAKRTVTVTAESRSYNRAPVSVLIATPKKKGWSSVVVTVAATGESVRSTCVVSPDEPTVEVIWIVEELAEGESRAYKLAFSKAEAGPPVVSLGEPEGGALGISINRELFTRYVFEGVAKPYCYPVIGPTGAPLTRGYPMEEIDGESSDHHHHKSFWFTFGEVNGHDFWAETDKTGSEIHEAFMTTQSGDACGVLATTNNWVAKDGTKILEDERELRIYGLDDIRLLDFSITLKATDGDVEFGDTKEGMFGFRLASTMRLDKGGHIVNSAGDTDGATWGKAAAWCDYYGPVGEDTVGIAIMDAPSNLRHPTYWHVRSYGLFAANPFGLKYFIGDETGAGKHIIPSGGELTFRYRVLMHTGTTEDAGVADWFEEFANPPTVTVR